MWYNRIVKDLSQLGDAVTYYNQELDVAIKQTHFKGSIERNSQELSGITAERFAQLQDVEAILKYLNIQHDKLRSQHYRKYLERYNRELSDRAIEKYIDGEDDIVSLYELINEVSLVRNRYLAVMRGLEIKHYQIGHVTKLRCSGLEDATV
jgi:hypothetical protein